MSNKTTYRFYVNNKRVATAVLWKPTSDRQCILEVFKPAIDKRPLQEFNTVEEWKEYCQRYYVPKQTTHVEITGEESVPARRETWTCCICNLPPGNDHRMCIAQGFRWSQTPIRDWEEASGIRKFER